MEDDLLRNSVIQPHEAAKAAYLIVLGRAWGSTVRK